MYDESVIDQILAFCFCLIPKALMKRSSWCSLKMEITQTLEQYCNFFHYLWLFAHEIFVPTILLYIALQEVSLLPWEVRREPQTAPEEANTWYSLAFAHLHKLGSRLWYSWLDIHSLMVLGAGSGISGKKPRLLYNIAFSFTGL